MRCTRSSRFMPCSLDTCRRVWVCVCVLITCVYILTLYATVCMRVSATMPNLCLLVHACVRYHAQVCACRVSITKCVHACVRYHAQVCACVCPLPSVCMRVSATMPKCVHACVHYQVCACVCPLPCPSVCMRVQAVLNPGTTNKTLLCGVCYTNSPSRPHECITA